MTPKDEKKFEEIESEFNACQFRFYCRDLKSQLRTANEELEKMREALKPLVDVPIEQFGWEKNPDKPIYGWNDYKIYVHDVLTARQALGAKGEE